LNKKLLTRWLKKTMIKEMLIEEEEEIEDTAMINMITEMVTKITETTTETEETTEITEMEVTKRTTTIEVENKNTSRRTPKTVDNPREEITKKVEREKKSHQEKSLKSLMKTWVNFLERTLKHLFKLRSSTNISLKKMMRKKRRTRTNQSKRRSQEDTTLELINVFLKTMERKKQACYTLSWCKYLTWKKLLSK